MSNNKNTFLEPICKVQTLHLGILYKSLDPAVAEAILSIAMRCVDFKRMDGCSSGLFRAKILWYSYEREWIV